MTATTLQVTHTGRNNDDSADRLEIRSECWEAVVYVTDGMWPTASLQRFAHVSGQEVPLRKERDQIRRAALKWAKENRRWLS